jgi:hypothetical protein
MWRESQGQARTDYFRDVDVDVQVDVIAAAAGPAVPLAFLQAPEDCRLSFWACLSRCCLVPPCLRVNCPNSRKLIQRHVAETGSERWGVAFGGFGVSRSRRSFSSRWARAKAGRLLVLSAIGESGPSGGLASS